MDERIMVRVREEATGETRRIESTRGATLRDVLLEAGISPHGRYATKANCGGRGLCATCGVRFETDTPDADHWHDKLAEEFGYPRLSCQIELATDCSVVVPDKRMWGGRA
ncbi:2Fe-2S iron-sulfur cluster-binding protein [Halapricum desulfuricans]|uniref:Ferredoxin n=1 Tax=Halapricum desulfuricans TaxID=2841257 RepID=A0A897N863_9EURY|nr:2Fe-2S iron-sulfur cluster-binding protein [Halapricum desulfuricans]QSG08982.1 Ferredoxin [Halapricum desulfuricans]